MKRFSFFSFFFLVFFFGIHVPSAFAVEVKIRPTGDKFVSQEVTFTLQGCKTGDQASFTITPGNIQQTATVDDKGWAEYATTFTSPDVYLVEATCGEESNSKNFAIRAPNNITPTPNASGLALSINPATPYKTDTVTFKVTGCKKDDKPGKKIEWQFWTPGNIAIGVDATTPPDSNGSSKTSRNDDLTPGTVNVKATCTYNDNTTTAIETSFTVLDYTEGKDSDNGTQLPTNIPPVSPVCREYNEAGKCTSVNTAIGPLCTEAECFISSIFAVILSLSGGIALLIIIYAGYLYMTSRGNAEQVKKAQELITSSLVGLLFIIFSFVIFTTIAKDILQIPGIE